MIPLKDDLPRARSPVTWTLIGLNLAVFAWQSMMGVDWSAWTYGAVPYEIWTGRDLPPRGLVPPPFTVLTSMFLHGGLLHLGFNLLFLWVFGNNVEYALGSGRYLLFYLACGVVSAAAQIALSGPVQIPMVGASGAIAGVLGAYLMLYPKARVLTVVPIVIFLHFIWLPASVFLVVWFGVQLIGSAFGGSVAWYAHVGGFLAGMVLIVLLAPGSMRGLFRSLRYRWS